MDGAIRSATRHGIAGWVLGDPARTALIVKVDDVAAGRIALPAQDAETGEMQIEFTFAAPLDGCEHRLAVQSERDGEPVPGSPVYLPGLRGRIDRFDWSEVAGWAQDTGNPHEAVALSIVVDGTRHPGVLAQTYRADLAQADIGDGSHAFTHRFDPPLPPGPHTVEVFREADGASLARSPLALDPAMRFDERAQAEIRERLGDPDTEDAIRLRLDFLAGEIARLVLRRSDRLSRRGERLAAHATRRRWLNPALPAPPALSRRALVIDTRVPDATRDAGSVALISHMRSLQRLGFEVVFMAADLGSQNMAALEELGIAGGHTPWFGSVEELLLAQADTFDVVYLHKWEVAAAYTGLVRRTMRRARLVYSVADLHHLRLARQATVERRPELAAHAEHIRQKEVLAALQADVVITHSAIEADSLRVAAPKLRPAVVAWSVPAAPGPAPFEARHGLAFIGSFAFPPNLDAALFLLDSVLPLVHAAHPAITCHLVGGDMPEAVRRTRPAIVAHGPVADLRGLLGGVRLTVAPLLFGAGIKGKVLESLAAGVPCVCSPVAAEGIELGPHLTSLVASDAAGLARSISRLHEDPALHEACRMEGLDYVARHLNEPAIDAQFGAALGLAS